MKDIIDLAHKEVCRITKNANVNRDITLNALLFTASSAIGTRRFKILHNGELSYINFFGTTFANSGTGKDVALNICEKIFYLDNENYIEMLKADFRKLNAELPTDTIEPDDKVDYIIPSKYSVPLRGSVEGIMRVGNFFNRTSLGSFNITSGEFAHEINKQNLAILTKLWQSGSNDGSTNVNEKYKPINNIPTNILLYGSYEPFKQDVKLHKELNEMLVSGLARRSFFAIDDNNDKKYIRNKIKSNFDILLDYGKTFKEHIKILDIKILNIDDEAEELLNEYMEKINNIYNKHKSKINEIATTNENKIARLSGIIALIGLKSSVDLQAMQQAIDIIEKSNKALKYILEPKTIYKRMYEELVLEPRGLSVTELIDKNIGTNKKSDIENNIELLEDYAFRFNQKIEVHGKAKKYRLVKYENTNLDEIIVAIAGGLSKEPEKELYYKNVKIPFFGDGKTVEQLVRHSTIKSFLTCHLENDRRKPEFGYRKKDNFISGQNLIAFDVDEGMDIKEAQDLLEQYQYIIYTTKSHNIEKNGIVSERYRILIPTKTEFYVTIEQHKELYENLSKVLGLSTYDIATRNATRLWFTNPNATIIVKRDGDLLDVRCCLPDTEKEEKIKYVSKEEIDEVSKDRRIQGMIRYTLQNAVIGNRNNALYRLFAFVRDISNKETATGVVLSTNKMLSEPLKDNEIKQIVRR